MNPNLTGFSPASTRRLVSVLVMFVFVLAGWAIAEGIGAAITGVLGVVAVYVPWWGQPAWSWAALRGYARREIVWGQPKTVANNRSGGGVRVQDGVAVAAVQLLGKPHEATIVTGSVSVETRNVVDVAQLAAMLHQPLGLELDSLSVVTIGARRGAAGDYPRVYDTEIGTPPYAGVRGTWLILRHRVTTSSGALRWRTSVGAAAIASAQRIVATLRCQGLRAKVASATDLSELDRRLGSASLAVPARRWKTLRAEGGWLTTYAYPPEAVTSQSLAQAWTLRVDEVIQNVTVYPDGACTATMTVRTPQPLSAPPSVVLGQLNGEQATALAASMCGPRPHLRGLRPTPLPQRLVVEIGPSGILVGKLANGDRLMIPLTDVGEPSRVFVAADEAVAKRIVIRAAGAGERVCVHTRDAARWASVRMSQVAVVGQSRPAAGTTVSVVDDGAVIPSPRPAAVITVAPPGAPIPDGISYEVVIEQVSRTGVHVRAAGRQWRVEMDLFRAENRYISSEPLSLVDRYSL
jgi:type VII secretion protein EccE